MPSGTVQRNVRYGATKCAGLVRQNNVDVVRQNAVGMVRRNVRYGASQCVGIIRCQNSATDCGNVRWYAAMVRRNSDGKATKWRPRSSDDKSTRFNYICEQL